MQTDGYDEDNSHVSRLLFESAEMSHPVPIPVVAQSKAWVCGRSLAGIAGSNPAGGMDVCLL
jgi:hypothetical protein